MTFRKIVRNRSMPRLARALVATLAATFAAQTAGAADKTVSERTEAPRVDVISTTPLPSLGTAREEIAAPVQTATAEDMKRSQSLDLTDFMNRNLGGVHINDVQNNPYQPDVSYRGFTASPLLGNPQGLSVYMDGVRMNQALGDQISWDLIPRAAISTITLMPGSNPLFGLNTLGGALSIQTKNGRNYAGTSVQTTYGSYNRRIVELEHGGYNNKGLEWFVTMNDFREDGWRDFSPSRVQQLFGKLGWSNARTDIDLTYSFAKNNLIGNGFTPVEFQRQRYSSIFTRPDQTLNNSNFLNLTAKHEINDNLLFSGNMYYRKIKTRTLNGDGNDDLLEGGVTGAPFIDDGSGIVRYDPGLDCSELANPEFAEGACSGSLNRSRARQHNYGLSGQFTFLGQLAGHRNQFIVGAAYDRSQIRFNQSTEFGLLNASRGVDGVGVFSDEGDTFLKGFTTTSSFFATDTLSVNERWHWTVSGRFNRINADNRDQLVPGPGGPGTGSLTGDHTFSRFNPAIGLSFTPNKAFNPYVGYNEGSRAPSSIELGCADPLNPCRLPNSLAGDPPLRKVVTRTTEIGVKGVVHGMRWNTGLFNANNEDDIVFVASGQTGFGYFQNADTRRRGLELGLSGVLAERWLIGTNYTFVDATFRQALQLPGENNSASETIDVDADGDGIPGDAQADVINVRSGNRVPLIPRHQAKFFVDFRATPAWTIGADVVALSSMIVRGNENNQHKAGEDFAGKGETGAFAIVNLRTSYQITPMVSVFARVNNVFDRQYNSAGVLGERRVNFDGSVSPDEFSTTLFGPGAPRIGWLGVRIDLDPPKKRGASADRD